MSPNQTVQGERYGGPQRGIKNPFVN